jgi:hypothetical protein
MKEKTTGTLKQRTSTARDGRGKKADEKRQASVHTPASQPNSLRFPTASCTLKSPFLPSYSFPELHMEQ